MKLLLFSTIISLFIVPSYGQNNCAIVNSYGEFILITKEKYDDNEYLHKRVYQLKNNNCYTQVINNNVSYVNYLLTNFSSFLNYPELLKIPDSLTLQKTYITSLKKDSTFNMVMTDLIAKTVAKSTAKDSVSLDELLNIAVKYFSISRITPEGAIAGKVCAGLNDIKKTEKERQPQVEAFCFSSILKNYQGEKFNMYDEFVKSIKELYTVNLGIDNNEKLLRAQGAMFMLMKNNEPLKKMLVHEYNLKKDYLPFVLITN